MLLEDRREHWLAHRYRGFKSTRYSMRTASSLPNLLRTKRSLAGSRGEALLNNACTELRTMERDLDPIEDIQRWRLRDPHT